MRQRLAHVGDRTGLELIRTLQDHTVYLGVTVHMEHTVIELILDGGRAATDKRVEHPKLMAVTFRLELEASGHLRITRDVGFEGTDVWEGDARHA